MTDPKPEKPIVPAANPFLLKQAKTSRSSIATRMGGKLGLYVWITTAIVVAYFGWQAWQKLGPAFRKVFQTNTSTSFASRVAFFESRFAAIEGASHDRKFGFSSPSTGTKILRVSYDGDALVLDASDAREDFGAIPAAKAMAAFAQPGADLDSLKLRFVAPRDPKALAELASQLFEAVLDGTPEGSASGVIYFDDLLDPAKK